MPAALEISPRAWRLALLAGDLTNDEYGTARAENATARRAFLATCTTKPKNVPEAEFLQAHGLSWEQRHLFQP
ncbi:hypothetical protein QCD70_05530 [Agreia sp. PsM10]|uniref:hypothetical protein n=1 Tax=Agreia sp. PsM10 TaxID=3030533 RepID=UPI00263B1F5D|nr:hypothetical protein [Agreia sp. PsM10]MDN4639701.1 hypothetical protein [Agreia sp. PsM10]